MEKYNLFYQELLEFQKTIANKKYKNSAEIFIDIKDENKECIAIGFSMPGKLYILSRNAEYLLDNNNKELFYNVISKDFSLLENLVKSLENKEKQFLLEIKEIEELTFKIKELTCSLNKDNILYDFI